MTTWLLGVDTGGTFTDFVLYQGKSLRIHKRLSTPHAPEEAILHGIKDLNLDPSCLQIVHGSTVATNAVLEGKGVKTAYISNYGLKDVLTIGRQARQELYALQPEPTHPPVAEKYCLETGGRLAATGEVVEPLTTEELLALHRQLLALAPRAVERTARVLDGPPDGFRAAGAGGGGRFFRQPPRWCRGGG